MESLSAGHVVAAYHPPPSRASSGVLMLVVDAAKDALWFSLKADSGRNRTHSGLVPSGMCMLMLGIARGRLQFRQSAPARRLFDTVFWRVARP